MRHFAVDPGRAVTQAAHGPAGMGVVEALFQRRTTSLERAYVSQRDAASLIFNLPGYRVIDGWEAGRHGIYTRSGERQPERELEAG